MNNILKVTTFTATLLGFGILVTSFLELRTSRKKLDKISNKDFFTETDKLHIIKYYKLSMIGFSITSIMQIIRIFLK
ncbi:hypothetical protein LGK95_13190 [Clostridium algoriphilum]|uniref:hypothetical protein n=1 Tax=Clostridium algoriphilum TaxID=198347 RepID=UPI001CF5AA1E|nr:hypothetical protein [Clostridium algoriphilum]MCB2294465.1 hypothetical protein [Clostridium algoriphilum]